MDWNVFDIGIIPRRCLAHLIAKLDLLWEGMRRCYGNTFVAVEASPVSLNVMIAEIKYRMPQINVVSCRPKMQNYAKSIPDSAVQLLPLGS